MEIKNITNLGVKKAAKIFEQKISKKAKNDMKFNLYVRQMAREILGEKRRISFEKLDADVANFSASDVVRDYAGKLEMTDSVWAPWCNLFKVSK